MELEYRDEVWAIERAPDGAGTRTSAREARQDARSSGIGNGRFSGVDTARPGYEPYRR